MNLHFLTGMLRDGMCNYRQAARLLGFRTLQLGDYRVSHDQIVWLIGVDILLAVIVQFFYTLPAPAFNPNALFEASYVYLTALLSVYLISRFVLRRNVVLAMYVVLLSTFPLLFILFLLLHEALSWLDVSGGLSYRIQVGFYFLIMLVLIIRMVRLFALQPHRALLVSTPLFMLLWVIPVWLGVGGIYYWYPGEADSGKNDPYAVYRQLDVEAMFYAQPDLLRQSLAELAPQRRNKADIYFLGFAGWARQDVFHKEINFVQQLFDQRFDTRGRSLALVNNLKTYKAQPLATSTNLRRALQHIGKTMDPEQDLLVLFMTSHGSRTHKLSVDFWPMRLNDVSPQTLKQYLDEAGIKWRVLIISACYSGGFVDTLRDDYTYIATAAAPDKESFGCSNENDFTYFGEAFFQQQLSQQFSFEQAFEDARQAIAQREQKEKITASQPQLHVGAKIRPRLQQLARRLAQQTPPLQALVEPVQSDKADCISIEQSCQ